MKLDRRLALVLVAAAASAGLPATAGAQAASPSPQAPPSRALSQDKVVYHIDDASTQALKGLRNIRNHLDTEPSTRVVVVTHADGVDFLMEGAKDRNGGDYAALVSALVGRGVRFEVCEITLRNRTLTKEQFVQEAEFTPSGVVKLAKLQKDGFAYIKP